MTLRPGPADWASSSGGRICRSWSTFRAHAENVGDTTWEPPQVRERHGFLPWSICCLVCRARHSTIAIVELSAPEVPSWRQRRSLVFLLQSAGIEEQRRPKRFIRVKKRLRVEDGGKWAEFDPFDGFKVNFENRIQSTPSSSARSQKRRWTSLRPPSQGSQPARARSGSCGTWRPCARTNLALGGNLDNAIVLDDFRVLNEDGLRTQDEFRGRQDPRCDAGPVSAGANS